MSDLTELGSDISAINGDSTSGKLNYVRTNNTINGTVKVSASQNSQVMFICTRVSMGIGYRNASGSYSSYVDVVSSSNVSCSLVDDGINVTINNGMYLFVFSPCPEIAISSVS